MSEKIDWKEFELLYNMNPIKEVRDVYRKLGILKVGHVCTVCDKPITFENLTPYDGKSYHWECFKTNTKYCDECDKLVKVDHTHKPICAKCTLPILGLGTSNGISSFHPECFKRQCDHCRANLEGMEHWHGSKRYHKYCWDMLTEHRLMGPICTLCQKFIEGTRRIDGSSHYHPECWDIAVKQFEATGGL